MDAFEKLHSGELYDPGDPELMEVQNSCLKKLDRFNALPMDALGEREELMKEMFAEVGEGCYITSPFYSNWGGRHIHLGKGVYLNFGVTISDDTHVYIGDYTQIAPNVTIATAGHPVLPELRGSTALEFNIPVTIGKNCWIGAGAIILPGITIGDDTVVGAGSVVVKDLPEGVVAVGNPCRVIRKIGERDREFYYKDRRIPKELLE